MPTNPKLKILPTAAIALTITVAGAHESLPGTTELIHWDQQQAFNGYTLFSSRGASFLIDMEVQVINTWPIGTTPQFPDNGDLLDASKDDPSGFGGFRELDWEGNVVWSYDERREGDSPHHDWVRIYNKALFRAYRYGPDHPALRNRASGCLPRSLLDG